MCSEQAWESGGVSRLGAIVRVLCDSVVCVMWGFMCNLGLLCLCESIVCYIRMLCVLSRDMWTCGMLFVCARAGMSGHAVFL